MALRRCCAALALAGAWCPPTRHIQRAVAPLRAESDGEETTKSIDEVLAEAEGYDGMPIVDPYRGPRGKTRSGSGRSGGGDADALATRAWRRRIAGP